MELVGIRFRNPTILASGIYGVDARSLIRVAKAGAGGVTMKSIGLEPRSGHPNPTVLAWECGLINAIGLSNPGAVEGVKELRKAVRGCSELGVPVIASFFGRDADEFGKVAEELSSAEPSFLEANISCPNVEGVPFAYEPEGAALVVSEVKKRTSLPLIVKLSPNTHKLIAVAQAVEKAGADIINMGNTLGPGMLIDIESRTPILSNRWGGVSGPAIHPISVRCVYQIYEKVRIPIIGTGGIVSGEDALRMVMAGARGIGIGSALYYHDLAAFRRILDEMRKWMMEHDVSSLKELVGSAHRG